MQLRPTIPSDLAHVTAETLPIRIRAITAAAGEQILGICGIGYREDGVAIAFAAINDELRKYPTALYRAGLELMRIIRESEVPRVIALADETLPGAGRFLERLDFAPELERGLTIYVWNAPRPAVKR